MYKKGIMKHHVLKRHGSSIDPIVALSYVREIKDIFVDQVEKYDMFLEVMKDFRLEGLQLNFTYCHDHYYYIF
ncbi:hypothetical protein H5410_050897 [Solanum commersonii]|uniref:Uncharacterized protein n=1 Tax=Solanum commersonii TaxID=4109 RepID=A0A9J5WZ60_SOLCO|nr:hypothetical protein H5410_050897 [Solanum commersonii]